MTGGAVGGALCFAALSALKAPEPLAFLAALVGGVALSVVAYMLGDRLNARVPRVHAPVGSVAIGSDGIRWRHFGMSEFIGWGSVRDVYERATVVVVQLEGRADVVLPVWERAAFVSAARDALQGYRAGSPAQTLAPLELTDGDIAGWLGRARALLTGGSYREAEVGEEQCVRVATDPRAPLAQRIGSAAALSKASDDARDRVRVAIEQTADPEVASALEDALEERDDPHALGSILRRAK